MESVLKNNVYIFLILFLTAIATYFFAFSAPFIFDDNLLVEHNVLIRSLNNVPDFFVVNSQSGAGVSGSNFYRPMQYIAYALLYQVFGLSPIAFHSLPVLLHILNAFLIFLFFGKLGFKKISSLLMSMLFIVHPVQTEAVSYVSGIADPLGLAFLLSGILVFLSEKKTFLNGMLTVALFVLAILSKESMIVFFPLAVLLVIYFWSSFSKQKRNFNIKVLSVLFGVSLFYLFLKFTVFDFTGVIGLAEEKSIYTESLYIRIITFINILWEYAKLIIYPAHLFLEKPYTAYVSLFSLRALFGLSVIFGGAYLAVRSFYRKKIFFLGFFWFFIALAPVSGIIPLNAIFLEHWLYTPIIGILIILAGVFDRMLATKSRTALFALFAIFLLFLSGRTIYRNAQWADAIAFYNNELQYTPRSARVHNNLAMLYSDKREYTLAIDEYKKAIAIRDIYPQTHHNLANAYVAVGDFKNAENEYKKALALDSKFMYSYVALFTLYKQTNPSKAIELQDFLKKKFNLELK